MIPDPVDARAEVVAAWRAYEDASERMDGCAIVPALDRMRAAIAALDSVHSSQPAGGELEAYYRCRYGHFFVTKKGNARGERACPWCSRSQDRSTWVEPVSVAALSPPEAERPTKEQRQETIDKAGRIVRSGQSGFTSRAERPEDER